jgi:hypothetical protein
MSWYPRRPRQPRRAAPRQSYKPEFDVLERRTLLSGVVGAAQAAPPQGATGSGTVVSSGGTASGTDDNESGAAVVFSKDELKVVVGGAGDSYTVVLATQPTADVTITINQVIVDPVPMVSSGGADPSVPLPSDNGPLQVTPSTLTFTSANWNVPQTVQVSAPAIPTAAGPAAYGPTVGLIHDVTSADPNYNNLEVPAVLVHEVNPNQGAVLLSKQQLGVTRGGAGDSFTVVLATQPTADVTITLAQFSPELIDGIDRALIPAGPGIAYPLGGNDPLQISPTTLTFTSANWDTPQTVTVGPPTTGSGGAYDVITATVTSTDPNYNGLFVPPVRVIVVDPNQARVVVSKDDLQVTRGGAGDSYTVVLATQPTADVTITIAQVQVEPYPVGWRAGDPNGPPTTEPPVPCPPPAPNDPLQISPTTLTFTAADWNVPQTVTVGPPASGSGNQFDLLTQTVASTDPNYNGLDAPSVAVEVTDPRTGTGGLVFSKTQLDVTQDGAGDSYTVSLTVQPTADVTVTIYQEGDVYVGGDPIPVSGSGSGTATGSATGSTGGVPCPGPGDDGVQLTITPTTLTFTPADWNVPQSVTVTAPSGTAVSGDDTVSLFHAVSSDDPAYQDLNIPPVSVTVHGSATTGGAGVILSTDDLNVIPGGSGASYTVVLASKPTADVTITIAQAPVPVPLATPDGGKDGSDLPLPVNNVTLQITPTTLTFTPDNWDTPQTVTVSAPAPSSEPEFGLEFLTQTVTSDDPNYNGLAVEWVRVAVVSPTVPPPIVLTPPDAVHAGGAPGSSGGGSATPGNSSHASGVPHHAAKARHHRPHGNKHHPVVPPPSGG